ncbi:MAG: zinc ribbon domain-containing protein [Salibacteraceae bacterium]
MAEAKAEVSVEEKLRALYQLQTIDTKIDKIRTIRGELPLEVRDLEDEIQGLETRIGNITEEIQGLERNISDKKNTIKDANALIKSYESKQMNVRNNREYDSLSKEIEFQSLEIQLSEKRIKEYKANIEAKNEIVAGAQERLDERKKDLDHKNAELQDIVAETQKEEDELTKQSQNAEKVIEDRLLVAYKRIRANALNGLAVVPVERDACGGCFNKIPPQRQLDIKSRKKVIVCEHCGRILVDPDINEELVA